MTPQDNPTNVDLLNEFHELRSLTPTELSLWRRLWVEQGHPVSKAVLLADVWGVDDTRALSVTLYKLRRKLRRNGWDVASHSGPDEFRYSLHPSTLEGDP